MQNVTEVMAALKRLGSEQTRKTFTCQGAPAEQLLGVEVIILSLRYRSV